MNKYVLLVINNKLFEDELKVLLKQLAEQEFLNDGSSKLMLDFESDVENATARVVDSPGKYSLLIVDLHIFSDSETPSHENQKKGLKFLKDLRDDNIPFFAILICPETDQEITDFPNKCPEGMSCEILLKKGDWVQHFEDKVRKGFGRPLGLKQKRGKVDIFFEQKDGEEHGKHSMEQNKYSMEGQGFNFEPRIGALKAIGQLDKDLLIFQSKNLDDPDRWAIELYFIGGRLLQWISEDNPNFKFDFKELVEKADGVENIRIRYIVEENMHPIALEAIIDEDKEYRMLHCPIFRSVNMECNQAPLFKDTETQTNPINCLIINANCQGKPKWGKNTSGPPLDLDPLENADKETCELKALLEGKRKNTLEFISAINKVDLLSAKDGEACFYDRVKNILETDTWHVVHFVGHSHYDDERHKGHVFFPGGRSQPIPVEIEDFARTLRKADVRLVYLSSCSGADVDFVFKLSENNIPSTLGFRCPIKDDKAMEHAIVFYEKLFLGAKRLEYAFLETRKELALKREYKEKDSIWAVSILVMQEKKAESTL